MTGWITVSVAETRGSTPRDAGTAMRIWPDRTEGTIGGGALEWEAIRHARAMLADGRTHDRREMILGPDIGQCCGGALTLEFAADLPDPRPSTVAPVWIWGAGHVGRALVGQLAPLPDLALTWIDTAPDRFPDPLPQNLAQRIAADPATLAAEAPPDARHYVLTYSHAHDLAICDALLARGFAGLGLIGSATKWARFRSRLEQMGHAPDAIARIRCPIGTPALGKHPQTIAIGVAYGLIMELAQ
ncbi:MAG: xanthine dehydrogenase accessory protein XdhC [Maritimibacter sp.]|nr:xanthine dehydrogenase accessory protein XdhC [Maritimibacter sp.]